MSLLAFTQWVQQTGIAVLLRESGTVYPLILSCHLLGIAVCGGMVLMADLRLLGIAWTARPVSEVVGQTRPIKWAGFAIVLLCGALLFCSKAEEYYYNAFFRTKLAILVLIGIHGLVFRRSVYANTAALDLAAEMPGRARLAGALSLLLWMGMIVAGRGIGYIEPPLDKIHARRAPAAVPLVRTAGATSAVCSLACSL